MAIERSDVLKVGSVGPVATERWRFGYRRLQILFEREGWA